MDIPIISFYSIAADSFLYPDLLVLPFINSYYTTAGAGTTEKTKKWTLEIICKLNVSESINPPFSIYSPAEMSILDGLLPMVNIHLKVDEDDDYPSKFYYIKTDVFELAELYNILDVTIVNPLRPMDGKRRGGRTVGISSTSTGD